MKNIDKILEGFPQFKEFDLLEFEKNIIFFDSIPGFHTGAPIIRTKTCLHCNINDTLKSHSISETVLRSISIDGTLYKKNSHWYFLKCIINIYAGIQHFQEKTVDDYSMSISTKVSSIFDGFCPACDKILFNSLDNGSNNLPEIYWATLYRTVSYKLRYLEELLFLDNEILNFANKNSSFFEFWKLLYGKKSHYDSIKEIQTGIKALENCIELYYKMVQEIKIYQYNLSLFSQDYYVHTKKISKPSYLGANHLLYYPEGDNFKYISKVKSPMMIGKLGILTSQHKTLGNSYSYFNIIIVKKEKESIVRKFNFNDICNYFLTKTSNYSENSYFKHKDLKK